MLLEHLSIVIIDESSVGLIKKLSLPFRYKMANFPKHCEREDSLYDYGQSRWRIFDVKQEMDQPLCYVSIWLNNSR